MTRFTFTRRSFIKGTGAGMLASLMPCSLSLASAATDKRLLLVILRGGMDGLAAVVPHGDKAYTDARGDVAMPLDGDALIDLDGYFAMHKSLGPLAALYRQKEMVILHACATPFRNRSHFSSQIVLENGAEQPGVSTGWLGRALEALPGASGIALLPVVPMVLTGSSNVMAWASGPTQRVDDDFMSRVGHMYQDDPLLAPMQIGMVAQRRDRNGGRGDFIAIMKEAADFFTRPDGARVGVVSFGGWDTHSRQGNVDGRLAGSLQALADGITTFKESMGDEWDNTAVLVATEFGRTVRANGSGGTDHGTAGAAFLLGGRVDGGRVLGDWPGLDTLYEGRDLIPANDLRSLLKSTLRQHLGLQETVLADSIFPDSRMVPPLALFTT